MADLGEVKASRAAVADRRSRGAARYVATQRDKDVSELVTGWRWVRESVLHAALAVADPVERLVLSVHYWTIDGRAVDPNLFVQAHPDLWSRPESVDLLAEVPAWDTYAFGTWYAARLSKDRFHEIGPRSGLLARRQRATSLQSSRRRPADPLKGTPSGWHEIYFNASGSVVRDEFHPEEYVGVFGLATAAERLRLTNDSMALPVDLASTMMNDPRVRDEALRD